MNLKKIVFVFALLLISDLTFTGCTATRKSSAASVASDARQLEIASRGQISPFDPIMRQVAEENEIPFWTFIQTIGFGLVNRRPQSKADIAFQVYTDLAYGAKGIQHFCYWQPLTSDGNGTVFTEAMISKDGQKTDIYEYAQAVNLEIQTFANAF